ncbi:MAG: DUF4397 domain-containing protein [Thermomicrobiales bacterium]
MSSLMKGRFTRFRLLTVLALVSALGINLIGGAAAQEDSSARVRVIHASPDAPAVDVLVNGERAVEGLEFMSGTDYLELSAGDYQFQVVPAGGAAEDAVIDATATIEAGTWYSVVAVGTLENIAPLIVVDDITEPAMDMAHIKVVHASPDAPAVDVAVADGPVLFENLEFQAASDYLPVDAGTYDLAVRPTGTEDVALEVPGLALEAGTVYSAYAMGQLGDGTLTVVPFVDQTFEQTAAAEPTPTEAAPAPMSTPAGTGGGDVPTMPNTGAGGTAGDSSDTLMWVIGGGALLLLIAGGSALAWSRRSV